MAVSYFYKFCHSASPLSDVSNVYVIPCWKLFEQVELLCCDEINLRHEYPKVSVVERESQLTAIEFWHGS